MPWKETRGRMPMLTEVVDAVIGIDTHRDSHEVEIADATGTPIATMRISNDSAGFGQLLTTIAEVVPGRRVAGSLEGSRSYGGGLARTLAAADQAVRYAEICRLALALRQARQELDANRKQLLAIVDDVVPGLTSRYGIGPVTAAQAVVSFSHPGRCRNEAAFAALGGTNPIPASSGRTVRHRLNRGGDRALNRAIHTIALTRIRSCPRNRAYDERRIAEGKSAREIRRCLKRYIARELYRQLTQSMKQPARS